MESSHRGLRRRVARSRLRSRKQASLRHRASWVGAKEQSGRTWSSLYLDSRDTSLTQSWCSAFEGNISLSQCCGSGMFIPDPDFYPPRIPDLGSRILDPGSKNSNKREGWKKISQNWTFINFWNVYEKIWANFQRTIVLFTQKLSLCSQKYGFGIRDPGIRKKPIPDPGSRGQQSTGSRIRIRNTGLNLIVCDGFYPTLWIKEECPQFKNK